MSRRRPSRPVRKRIFIGTEGASEAAFSAFLQNLCDEQKRLSHLDVHMGSGGSPISVLKKSLKRRKIGRRDGVYFASLCILDRDTFDCDPRRQEVRDLANREAIDLILQSPNLEGVLVRLHPGQETRQIPAGDSLGELRRHWDGYIKPPIAKELLERFTLADLRRAAAYDPELQRLLGIVRLI